MAVAIVFVIQCEAGPFTKDIPYDQAVPAFLEAVTLEVQAVKDEQELAAIGQWEEQTRSRIQEFLDDLIQVSIDIENLPPDEVSARYEDVADKWLGVIYTFPDIGEVLPGIQPLVEQLFSGLPQIRAHRWGQDAPLQNLYEWYFAMEVENPWGTAAYYQLLPIEPILREFILSEIANVKTVEGIETIKIIHRETIVRKNGTLIFYELIQNDQVIQNFAVEKDPTLIHELLRLALLDNVDPFLIDVLKKYVELIDDELAQARDQGILDADVYDFVYGLNCDIYGNVGCHQPSWLRRKVQSSRERPSWYYFLEDWDSFFRGQEDNTAHAVTAVIPPLSTPKTPYPLEGSYVRVRINEQTPSDRAEEKFRNGVMTLCFSSFLWLGIGIFRMVSLPAPP
jgi:hypothetical protein